MKNFRVIIWFYWEGYSGHEHCECKEKIVSARNVKSAINKVAKEIPKYASIRNISVGEE